MAPVGRTTGFFLCETKLLPPCYLVVVETATGQSVLRQELSFILHIFSHHSVLDFVLVPKYETKLCRTAAHVPTMSARIVFFALAALCTASTTPRQPFKVDYSGLSEAEILGLFREYQLDFFKSYSSAEEESQRLEAFKLSLQRITLQNKQDTAFYGLTPFSDLTPEEFQDQLLQKFHKGNPVPTVAAPFSSTLHQEGTVLDATTSAYLYNTSVHDDCDWRHPSTCNSTLPLVVSAVKNQNACGGCYAYAAVAAVESAFAFAGYAMTPLSVSQILDCDSGM